MKGNRKIPACALCALMLLGVLTSCGGGRRLTLRIGAGAGASWQTAAEDFRDRVESGGRYKVSIRKDADPGSCDLELDSLLAMTDRAPAAAVVSMPWLFPDGSDGVDRALLREDGPGREMVFRAVREAGLEPLALGENGFYQLTCDTRSLTAPADLPGISLTVPADGPLLDYLRTLGVAAEARTGVFSELQDAALDGHSDTVDGILADRSYLVQRYMTVWNCAYDPLCLSASDSLWARLSEEERILFRNAAQTACAEQVETARSAITDALTEFRESGVEVAELDDNETAVFRALAGPIYEKWRAVLGEEAFAPFGVTF
ncbi:MAG: TRAP transporter substrate-binding protein DctP [Oscillibacter sp.]|nr:TRAP transporter substrate-binding protein DctP [Oscillibacter sp.]